MIVSDSDPTPALFDVFRGTSGFAFELSSAPELRARCDFIDGIAKLAGALDTVVFQPAGSSELVVGFAALPGALGRSISLGFGSYCGRGASRSTAVIVGAGAAAACAIAAVVQHGFDEIVIASDSPGPAIGAAHRMEIEISHVPYSAVESANIDLLINTEENRINAQPKAVCDLTGAWEDFAGGYVPPKKITAHQRQDQVRVLTGKSPSIADILAVS